MELNTLKLDLPQKGTVFFLIDETLNLTKLAQEVDKTGAISKALKISSFFKGKKGQTLSIALNDSTLDRIVLVGSGKTADYDTKTFQTVGGKIAMTANCMELSEISVAAEYNHAWKISEDEFLEHLLTGLKLRNYNYDHYFVSKKDEHKIYLKKVNFMCTSENIKSILSSVDALINGVFLTRNLVTMPPNVLYPESFADECKKLEKLGVKVSIFKEAEMRKMGMNALLGVSQGSVREGRLVVMEWNGHPKKNQQPIAFVGKGVTFDSGGISIKPATGMADMKYDMAGAGTVTGLMHTLAGRKAKVNAIGVIGIVENMPSGNAQRPGDVVFSMSGQTIEIDNTDAEGRLVLADALWYTQKEFKPEFMVNLATLTGAIVVALGEGIYAGLFSNNDELAEKLLLAGESTGEGLWRMPLKESYDKMINSEIADVKNTSNGKGAGSTTAAQFLQRFVNKYPWAHLDIAGMAWEKTGNEVTPKGATGYGVRLLNKFVLDNYEAK